MVANYTLSQAGMHMSVASLLQSSMQGLQYGYLLRTNGWLVWVIHLKGNMLRDEILPITISAMKKVINLQ